MAESLDLIHARHWNHRNRNPTTEELRDHLLGNRYTGQPSKSPQDLDRKDREGHCRPRP